MEYSNEKLQNIYYQLSLGRKYDEKVLALVNTGTLPGFFHLSIGEEAAQIGVVDAMGPNDYLVPTHRFHPGLVNRMDHNDMTAELLGKTTGICKGKAFTFHISSDKDRILAVNGMIGAGTPNAVGYSWAIKQNKEDAVVVCVLGDGATAEGNVHEGMNIASILKCPIVFFIENNGWAMSTPTCRESVLENLADRGKGYNMPGVTVDGTDVLAVREAMVNAIALAKKGQPNIVEAKLTRWRGHFEGDPATYRDGKIIVANTEEGDKIDPVKIFAKYLLEKKAATKQDLEALDKKADQDIEEMFTYAINGPLPTAKDTLDYDQVYATNLGGSLI